MGRPPLDLSFAARSGFSSLPNKTSSERRCAVSRANSNVTSRLPGGSERPWLSVEKTN